jgi:transcriptional regulator with XRE-family HTH domain
MSELAKAFGERVRSLRLARGLTQPELADASGVSTQWLKMIEAGRASPSFARISALADALEVRPPVLFGDPPPTVSEELEQLLKSVPPDQAKWLLAGARYLRRPAE